MSGVGGAHHVLGVELLLRKLGHSERLVRLRGSRGQRRESQGEEVQAGEGHKVDGEFADVAVELAGEAQRAGRPADRGGDEVVQVSVGGGRELERLEADVVKRLVVEGVH